MAQSHEIFPTRSVAAGVFAVCVLVLGIIGLSGPVPSLLAAVATITMGVALSLEGRAIAHRVPPYAPGLQAGPSESAPFRGTTATETLTGVIALVLGILGVLNVGAMALLPIATIVTGAGILIESSALRRMFPPLGGSLSGPENHTGRVAMATAGLDAVAGLVGVVLGILALVGVDTSTLVLISLLLFGLTMTVNSTLLTREVPEYSLSHSHS